MSIQLSAEAHKLIREIRAKREAPAGVGLKLIKGTRGELALMWASVRPGDIVVRDGESPLLLVDGETASEHRGCILDVRSYGGNEGMPIFKLLSPLADLQ
jgi:hypothetical protein